MRTVAYFRYKGRTVYIRGCSQLGPRSRAANLYRAFLDGEEIPFGHPDARELEAAIRALIDQGVEE